MKNNILNSLIRPVFFSYGCESKNTKSAEFITDFLTTFDATLNEVGDENLGTEEKVRIHFGKLLNKVGCSNPDANYSKFTEFFKNWWSKI